MLYAIMSQDVENSLERRKQARPAHIARLQTLQDNGQLMLAGPHPNIDSEDPGSAGFSGSLVVAEFPSLLEAQDWANNDPYLASGAYEKVIVKPFKRVFPNNQTS